MPCKFCKERKEAGLLSDGVTWSLPGVGLPLRCWPRCRRRPGQRHAAIEEGADADFAPIQKRKKIPREFLRSEEDSLGIFKCRKTGPYKKSMRHAVAAARVFGGQIQTSMFVFAWFHRDAYAPRFNGDVRFAVLGSVLPARIPLDAVAADVVIGIAGDDTYESSNEPQSESLAEILSGVLDLRCGIGNL